MGAAPPSGTVTFLCEAVDSPGRQWTVAVEETAAALELHAAIVREAIGQHGGYLFASDDERFAAAFAAAADAAEAAMELQRRMYAERDRIGFEARVGLHTGEGGDGGGKDVGPEVNRAARLASLANGGQIVVSESTEPLLRGRMPLRALGEYRLRDLDRRMTVHQLVTEGLPSEFPALRSVDPRTGNLPEQVT